MFNISLFTKIIKNKFTNSINLIHSKRVDDIISKNNTLHNMERVFNLIDAPLVAIPNMSKTEDPRVLIDFETILDLDKTKDFKWFQCWYNSGGVVFDNTVICSNKTEEEIYNKLLKIENLKAFL